MRGRRAAGDTGEGAWPAGLLLLILCGPPAPEPPVRGPSAALLPLALLALPSTLPAQAPVDSLLARLEGHWHMTGQVRGAPVTYTLDASRTLAGRWVELHMLDIQRPPQYEARVFIGADTIPGRVLVHWLDSFGAAYSVPHGEGTVTGDTLRFTIPYRDGPFRDTFAWNRADGSWHFLLESGNGSGRWRTFAEYDVRPAHDVPTR